MRLIPGFSSPSPQPPPPPAPDRGSAETEEARRRQREAAKRRAGRAATILSDDQSGSPLGASVRRPQAQAGGQRSAQLLGS